MIQDQWVGVDCDVPRILFIKNTHGVLKIKPMPDKPTLSSKQGEIKDCPKCNDKRPASRLHDQECQEITKQPDHNFRIQAKEVDNKHLKGFRKAEG